MNRHPYTLLVLWAKQPWAWIGGALLLMQQGCITSAYYIPVKATQALQDGEISTAQLGFPLFLLFILGSKLSGTCVQISSSYLFQKLYFSYCQKSFEKFLQCPSVLSQKTKGRWLNFLTVEAYAIFQEIATLPFHLGGTLLSLSLTALTLCKALDRGLWWALCILLGLSFMGLALVQRRLALLWNAEQKSRVDYAEAVRALWDPLFYGNLEVKVTHQKKAQARAHRYFKRQLTSEALQQTASFLPFLLAISLLVAHLFFSISIRPSTSALMPLTVLLPLILRLFDLLQEAIEGFKDGSVLKAKCAQLEQGALEEGPSVDLKDRISYKALALIHVPSGELYTEPLEQFLGAVASCSIRKGRWRLSGPNGAGKSSFLLRIKQSLPDAWLLGPGISFFQPPRALSEGEMQRYQMERLLDQPPNVPLLLDEWEAHLDAKQRSIWEKMLSEASKSRLIVEVNHRQGGPVSERNQRSPL